MLLYLFGKIKQEIEISMNTSIIIHRLLQNLQISWISLILRESLLSWQFIRGDISSAVIPPLLFIISASRNYELSVSDCLLALGKGLVYFWFYIFSFCLSNQIEGFEEDKINKPHRPIVQGFVSIHGALIRWIIASIMFLLIGLCFWVGEWALLWLIVTVFHNFCGWSKNWVGKNLLMSIGIIAQLAAAWQIVGLLTKIAWSWIFVSAVIIFPLVSIQDLRDMPGDIVNRRKTLPLVIGEYPTRFITCLFFVFLPLLIHVILFAPTNYNFAIVLCEIILALVSWLIAFRLISYRTLEADSKTYSLFTYWYCLEIASSILCISGRI